MILSKTIVLYHLTKQGLVSIILREGLKPILRSDSPLQKPAIYLAPSPRGAATWAIDFIPELQDTGFTEPMTVLAVRLRKGTELYFDPESFGEGFYVTHPISPENIRVHSYLKPGRDFPPESEKAYDKRYERIKETAVGFEDEAGGL